MTDGADRQRWIDGLAAVTRDQLDRWGLRPDGDPKRGSDSLVLPVRTDERTPAVLKIGFPDPETEHEHLVLRRWAGDGAVRLLRADPHRRAVLVERLRSEDLDTRSDVEAAEIVAGLYRRLHVPALPQLRSLSTVLDRWADQFDTFPRSAPIPHRLVEQATALSRELATEATNSGCVLHGDLHYRNVLAADRAPWLAISPRPINGDPPFEIAPLLWHRWDGLDGDVRARVRARFHTVVDAAGFDEDRARAWVLVRVVHQAAVELAAASSATASNLTRLVTIAKAVQD